MKKILKSFFVLSLICFMLTGCGAFGHKVESEFDVADLQRVEIFHFVTSDSPLKKTVTSEDDIAKTLSAVKDLKVTSSASKSEIPDNTDTYIFRFVLNDDALCTVIYNNVENKMGILSISSSEHHFVKGKNILALWDTLDVPTEEVTTEDIPKLK